MINTITKMNGVYRSLSLKDFIIPSFFIAANRLIKVVIMIVPLQFVLLSGGGEIPNSISLILPDFFIQNIKNTLILICLGFIILLLIYVYVNYKCTSLKPEYLNKKLKQNSELLKKNKNLKDFLSRSIELQSDIILNLICLMVILIFNYQYFLFCFFVLIFAFYLFDDFFPKKLNNSKNIFFYTEIYSMAMYILMVAFLSYSVYNNQSGILHIVPIFFVSRMMVISIPRLTRNIFSMNKSGIY